MVSITQIFSRLDSQPPAPKTRLELNATLIVSWWCTIFSLIIILIRVMGRWVRTEQLFREDKVMLWSIVPLMIRMAFIHPVLLWGTNNVVTSGLTEIEIYHRSIGSRLVLGARIWYAVYIWAAKVAVLEFVQKIISKSWTKFYRRGAFVLYVFLALTLIAVIVATLAECHPFNHYWQVVPNPGHNCRSGSANLITMGTCDIVSDVALIVFPVPLVIMSRMRLSKKVSLTLLFLLSFFMIAITGYRMPAVIQRNYSQQYRSLLASLEIFAATAVSNGIVIGSFLRDKGVKKRRYRAGSAAYTDDDNDGSILSRPATRTMRPSITQKHWGSDEDLVRGLGLTVSHELRHATAMVDTTRLAPMAPIAEVATDHRAPSPVISPQGRGLLDPSWSFRKGSNPEGRKRTLSNASTDSSASSGFRRKSVEPYSDDVGPAPGPESPYRKMSFFDVGGLVDLSPSEESSLQQRSRRPSAVPPTTRSGQNFIADIGGLLGSSGRDSESSSRPSASGFRNSLSLLSPRKLVKDIDRSIGRMSVTESDDGDEGVTEAYPMQQRGSSVVVLPPRQSGPEELDFADAGGLLK